MKTKSIAKILLAVAIFGIIGATAVRAYATADSFRNPLSSYAVTGYRFSEDEQNGYWHSGEDLKAGPLTPVYAIANGQVKVAKEGSSGYEQVVTIEHTLPDGSKIVSIYGHLSKRTGYKIAVAEGTEVSKGRLLGYVGYDDENGIGGPHLHFGIRKGAYESGKYEGRLRYSSELSNFYKPSDYLNLIRAVNTNSVYRLANIGSKVSISSSDTFNSCGWRWDDIRPVTSTELNSHSTAYGMPCFAPGTFIKRSTSPEISLIKEYTDSAGVKNRFRQRFTNWDAFIRAGGKSDLSNVYIVSNIGYNLHTQGKDLTYNANS